MLNILIFIFVIFYLILAKKNLQLAILFIIALLPSYLIRSSIFNIPFTLLELMILSCFIIWLLFHTRFLNIILGKERNAKKKNKKVRYPFDIEIIVILIVALMAVFTAKFSNSSLGILKAYFLEPILFFILIINNFQKKSDIKKIFYALSFSAALVSVVAIYQQLTGNFIFNSFWQAAETRRVVSVFGYPNAVGLYLAPIIMVMMGLGINEKLKYKLLLGITIILSLASIFFAKSEGALIGIAAAVFVCLMLFNKKTRIISIIGAILITAVIFGHTGLKKYAIEKITLSDKSGQIRMAQWKETWIMLNDGRILQGSGLANYQQEIYPYHQEGIFIKNDDPDWHRKTVFNEEYRKKMWQPLEI